MKQSYAVLHANFPTVLMLSGKATEIRCGVCGANATKPLDSGVRFFSGPRGLLLHMTNYHGAQGTSVTDVIATCERRVLEAEDVKRIEEGLKPTRTKIKKVLGHKDASNSDNQTVTGLSDVRRSTTGVLSVPGLFKTALPAATIEESDHEDGIVPDPNEILHADFPTVVFLDEQWVDISCHLCGANAAEKHQRFFNGSRGLMQHTRVHGISNLKDCLELCNRRLVDVDDIDRMANGEAPLHTISMRFGTVKRVKALSTERQSEKDYGRLPNGEATAHDCEMSEDDDIPLHAILQKRASTSTIGSNHNSLRDGLVTGDSTSKPSRSKENKVTKYEEWQNIEKGTALPARKRSSSSSARRYGLDATYSDDSVDYPLAKRRK